MLFCFFDSLQDKVRTESYRDFMYRNPEVFKDKVSRANKHKQICVCVLMCLYSMCRVAAEPINKKQASTFRRKDINKVMVSDLKHSVILIAPWMSTAERW